MNQSSKAETIEQDNIKYTFFYSIDDQLLVKLADNSLSRDLFPSDYHCLGDSENRPIKWMALEAIQSRRFSEASDTWAFGVLMWELCTLARQPYIEVNIDILSNFEIITGKWSNLVQLGLFSTLNA